MLGNPDVRRLERDTLIDSVALHPGQTVLDIQSAGGYLSDEIHRRLNGDVKCLCLEPCEALASRLNSAFTWIDDPVEHFASLDDGRVGSALGLAGLHHSTSHAATISEAYRVLKPGGQLAICDVEQDSFVARWLNEYVDAHNPAGHRGYFLNPGAAAQHFRDAGFTDVTEVKREVPWLFEHRSAIPVFFKGIFGLTPSAGEVDKQLAKYFDITPCDGGVQVNWELIYCVGRKPIGDVRE